MTANDNILQLIQTYDINHIFAQKVYRLVNKNNLLEEAKQMIFDKPKPFVKWVGGKRQLLTQFRKMGLYPPQDFDPQVNFYHEPFVGGGAVFFDLLPENAILSDLNNELIITYNVIKRNVKKLIKSLQKHINTKEYFISLRAQDPCKLSELDTASRFIYLNRTCFNGMYRVNKKGGFNVPFGKYTNI